MGRYLLIFLFIIIFASSSFSAEVENIKSQQVGNRVLFTFDVTGTEGEAEVSITITIQGKTYTSENLHLEGDYGKVKVGKGRKIYWNVLQDFPRGFSGNIDCEIIAGGKTFKDPITGMEFIFVKGGCYQMGDTFGDGESDEKPVHEVCVDDYYIGKYEVTQGQWKAIMGNNPSHFQNCGDNCPVEKVSYNDAQEFINKLNQRAGSNKYRLPTEAEWEYAARSGGKSEKYAGGNNVDSVAWYSNNSGSRTHPVGQKQPNGLGIHDMSGNVWEWVQDWYGKDYYRDSPKDNPKGPYSAQTSRVLRGGGWSGSDRGTRTAFRGRSSPDIRYFSDGFRCVRTP